MAPSTVVHFTSQQSRDLLQLLGEVKSLWRNTNRNQENECLALVDLLEKTRLKWLESFETNERRKHAMHELAEENRALRNNLELVTEQLRETRAQVAGLTSRNVAVEHELAELAEKFDLAGQLLKDEDDDEVPLARKRSRDDNVIANGGRARDATFERRSPSPIRNALRNRSFSEPNMDAAIASARRFNAISPIATSTIDIRTPRTNSASRQTRGLLKTWTNGIPIEQRKHSFCKKWNVVSRDHCDGCGDRFGFAQAAFTCSDCRIACHEKCQEKAPIPCIPYTTTPKTPSSAAINARTGQTARLQKAQRRPPLREFCPAVPPMIPHVLIHCVLALERSHLNYMGIYRIPGSEAAVTALLAAFKAGRAPPRLEKVDVETITGCIKRFLAEIHEPLIPSLSWRQFVRAASASDGGQTLHAAIAELPMPQRDTLAFLCAHWQRVADCAAMNKMPKENLARCLAPTVVGFSSEAPTMEQANAETPAITAVMDALLTLPREYWIRYYTYDQGASSACATPKTPGMGASPVTPVRFRATPGRRRGGGRSPDGVFENSLLGPLYHHDRQGRNGNGDGGDPGEIRASPSRVREVAGDRGGKSTTAQCTQPWRQ